MRTIPADYAQTADVMSNFDHKVEEWAEKRLKEREMWGGYPGWNFYGFVWFDEEVFWCQVKQYGRHVATMYANTLSELMKKVCDVYGYE